MFTKMKKGMFLALFVALVTTLGASNNTAIDYYDAGDLAKAKAMFLATQNPDAMDYYYLGTILLREKNTNEAKANFEKGLKADPSNLYNKVGLAAIQIASDPKGADKELKAISRDKAYKKDPQMQTTIAEVYARAGNTPLFQSYLARAKKVDKKSPLPYILEGNLAMEQGKTNDAAVQFENARYFDPNSKIALVKLAQLYVRTRRQIAFEHLDKATSIDPNYEYGWKTQADLRRVAGFYPEAKAAFQKYLSLTTPTPEDHQIYGQILYFAQEYDEALAALSKAPVNTVTSRLKMYSMFEQKKYDEALPFAQKLINEAPKNELITQDYLYTGDMLNSQKEYAKAAKFYEMAFEADTTETKLTNLSKAAKAYDNAANYPKAIELYQKAVDENPEHTLADIYSLGACYYSAGTDAVAVPEETKRMEYLTKASEVFGQMDEMFPEHYLGVLSQARANSAMDPETTEGLAKPYYERALTIMQATPDERIREILEVYQYMGIYYLKADKYDESREYWVKVLELDPENALAKQVIASLDSAK